MSSITVPSLIHDLQHHAADKADVASTLALLFATELNPAGWQVLHGGKGNNSWRIYLKREGKKPLVWYFTGYEKGQILARNDYWWIYTTKRYTLKTRVDVIRFTRAVLKGAS